MYILSDLDGNIIQKSNAPIDDLQVLIDNFSNAFDIIIIGTTSETLYNKTFKFSNCKTVVKNNIIVDIIPLDDVIDLDNLKKYKIEQTTNELENYLKNNPLLHVDGKYYSVTKDKQNLLANAINVYQMKVAVGIPAILKWNDTGKQCIEWTLENLIALAISIANYVEPLVAHQQALEVQIKNCTTQDGLDSIIIDYEVI